MKQKIIDDNAPITRSTLKEVLQDYPTKSYVDEKLKEYPTRSEMFDRFDQLMGILEQIREDILFHTHDPLPEGNRYRSRKAP